MNKKQSSTGGAFCLIKGWMNARVFDMPALLIVAALLPVLVAPLFLGSYGQRVVATAFMYLALAQSWNLIGGYAGLM
ncbi:MAG: hypothetical protein WCJ72_12200, partial [Chryseobacterium sp.]